MSDGLVSEKAAFGFDTYSLGLRIKGSPKSQVLPKRGLPGGYGEGTLSRVEERIRVEVGNKHAHGSGTITPPLAQEFLLPIKLLNLFLEGVRSFCPQEAKWLSNPHNFNVHAADLHCSPSRAWWARPGVLSIARPQCG